MSSHKHLIDSANACYRAAELAQEQANGYLSAVKVCNAMGDTLSTLAMEHKPIDKPEADEAAP